MKAQRPFSKSRRKGGFTLMELTMAMTLGMGIMATAIVMIQQHANFNRLIGQFSFLRDEAPMINILMERVIQRADAYRIYGSLADAKTSSNAVNTGGTAVWLQYRNPDGSFREAIISYEVSGGGDGSLNYYNYDGSAWPNTPSWVISSQPDNVTFANKTGVMLITVTGPNSEEITYVGNSK